MKLRAFLDQLEEKNMLTRITKPVSHEYEIANIL